MALLHRLARQTLILRRLSHPSPLPFSTDRNPNPNSNKREEGEEAAGFSIPIVSYEPLPEDGSIPPPPRRRDRRDDIVISADAIAADRELSPSFSSSVIPAAYEVKPKVAPLPEYRPQEEEQVSSIDKKTPGRPKIPRFHSFIAEDDLNIPLPSKVKVETKRRPDPINLVEAIRQVKVLFACMSYIDACFIMRGTGGRRSSLVRTQIVSRNNGKEVICKDS